MNKIKFKAICVFIVILHGTDCFSQENSNTHFRLLTYGMPMDRTIMNFVAQKWGIEYFSIAGCLVTEGLIDSAYHHNKVVDSLIIEKYGIDWEAKLNKEVQLEYENQKMVNEIISKSHIINKRELKKQTVNHKIHYVMEPISTSAQYKVEVKGWVDQNGENVLITFCRFFVDYKTKTIKIE